MSESGYLLKHSRYIEYRAAIIRNFLSSDSEERLQQVKSIIFSLINLSPNNCLINFPVLAPLEDLISLTAMWDFINDGDIIGYLYQLLNDKADLKNSGQFFTPDKLAEYIVTKAIEKIDIHDIKILDPACGSGQFLIKSFMFLFNRLLIQTGDRDLAASKSISLIHGTDIDPIAAEIAKFNLMKISGAPYKNINVHVADYLTKPDTKIFHGPILTDMNKYDIILGNPPWRSRFSPEEKKYYKSNYTSTESGINTFSLFIERSFDHVNPNGIIAFLIPEAYLNIKMHMSSRRYVLNNANIISIEQWGEKFKGVFAPCVSVILKKENSENLRKQNIIRVRNNGFTQKGVALLVPQASYSSTPENIFSIYHTSKAAEIFQSIEENNCIYLKNRAKFFLGVVTGNNSRFLSPKQTERFSDPILIGRDIQQFKIMFSGNYFKYDLNTLQQVAPEYLYRQKNKILYKFIGKRLTFALDTLGFFTLNNVNGFIPEEIGNSILTTLSILNSKVLQYYYQTHFFTLKVLRGNIEKLPIKIARKESQKKIDALATHLLFDNPLNDKYRNNIEDIIFHEYGIKDRIANMICEQIG